MSKETSFQQVKRQRDAAIALLAEWCVSVDVKGSCWDDWDKHYKDAMFRDWDDPEIRALLDTAIYKERRSRTKH